MGYIYQGQNDPLVLEIESEEENILASIAKFSAQLFHNEELLKEWDLEDVSIEDNLISLPLTEKETLEFPEGKAKLDIKCLFGAHIQLIDIIEYKIIKRNNHKRLMYDSM